MTCIIALSVLQLLPYKVDKTLVATNDGCSNDRLQPCHLMLPRRVGCPPNLDRLLAVQRVPGSSSKLIRLLDRDTCSHALTPRRINETRAKASRVCPTCTNGVQSAACRARRDLEVAGLAASFQEALSNGGARLPVIRAYDRLQHAVRGGGPDGYSASGSIWRGLIASHWRATAEVRSLSGRIRVRSLQNSYSCGGNVSAAAYAIAQVNDGPSEQVCAARHGTSRAI